MNKAAKSRKLCFVLQLKNDPELIQEYENYHRPENAWPEVTQGIRSAGILDMEIYRSGTQLIMHMEVDETYHPSRKLELDRQNPAIQKWEALMEKFQDVGPDSTSKWEEVSRIYSLRDTIMHQDK